MTDNDDLDPQAKPTEGEATVKKYLSIIDQYDRDMRKWTQRCDKIIKIYTEVRRQENSTTRRMSLLWSNISTLQPAIYAKTPAPSVNRRFKDDDPIARSASEMMERCLTYSFDDSDIDCMMRSARDDFLLTGRGTGWVRYDAEFDPLVDNDGNPLNERGEPLGPESEEEQGSSIRSERVAYDYVNWKDFGHNVARHWSEVTCVWKKVYMTRAAGLVRFGAAFKDVGLDHKLEGDEARDDSAPRPSKATVYEIWDKTTKKVFFIAKEGKEPLEVVPPYLDIKGFFPCPKPAYGSLSTSSLIPTPDYVFYQDQVEEIDDLTARIGALVDSLKVAGFYPSGAGDASAALQKIFEPGVENVLIPIPNWNEFKAGGGSTGLIEWYPVDQVIKVLEACFKTRQQLINDVYQITGISDIMRGEGDKNETATAQNIKSQWGSVRIRDRQAALAYFARDCARIGAEIMADKFQPETLLSMSNMKLPSRAQLEAEALQKQQIALQQQAAQAQQMQLAQQAQPQGQPMPMGMPA